MVEWLLEHGAAARDEDGSGNTPLHCAALGGDTGQLVVYNQQYTHTHSTVTVMSHLHYDITCSRGHAAGGGWGGAGGCQP